SVRQESSELCTLSLRDALPILLSGLGVVRPNYEELFSNYLDNASFERELDADLNWNILASRVKTGNARFGSTYVTVSHTSPATRSEEHTSELQSRESLVCRLQL